MLIDRVTADVTHLQPIGTRASSTPVQYPSGTTYGANENVVFNLVSDLLLAILPVPMVWKLQTNIRTRFSLCMILGLGLL